MHSHLRFRLHPLQLLHRLEDALSDSAALYIAGLQHGVGIHGGMDGRVLAVALHEDVGAAVDVEVGDPY